MAGFEAIGRQFAVQFYTLFDSNRPNLAVLYREQSMLTFEGTPVQGQAAIMEKLMNLGFQSVQHRIDPSTIDVQPSMNGAVLVLCSGDLVVDGNAEKPLKFCEVFHLIPEGDGWWCYNDIFRLNYMG